MRENRLQAEYQEFAAFLQAGDEIWLPAQRIDVLLHTVLQTLSHMQLCTDCMTCAKTWPQCLEADAKSRGKRSSLPVQTILYAR
eukprot:scaffold332746_cov34-Prasinocladus_malaysianus.AAC.1